MKIAWFIHRYFPIVGGAENYGRAIVRRFVAAGHEADVVTSDAHDLWYFTNKGRKPGRRAGRLKRRRRDRPPVPRPAPPVSALRGPTPELRPALADPVPVRRVVHADSCRVSTTCSRELRRRVRRRVPLHRLLLRRASGPPGRRRRRSLILTPFLHLGDARRPGEPQALHPTAPDSACWPSRILWSFRPGLEADAVAEGGGFPGRPYPDARHGGRTRRGHRRRSRPVLAPRTGSTSRRSSAG